MPIRLCVAGVTGWTGSVVARRVLLDPRFSLVSAVSRGAAGTDIGDALGLPSVGVRIAKSVSEALDAGVDVLVDYTNPEVVKAHASAAILRNVRVVIGTSGLAAADFDELEALALARNVGVVAAGNFSITAALAKHFSLLAARYLPAWELIDYASSAKVDAPSGTTRELAEALGKVAKNEHAVSVDRVHGMREARGASIAGTQVHSLRLPSYTIAFETIFGLPNERLTIRHDAGTGAEPYVDGTLLAIERVMRVSGLVRGLDALLFE